MRGSTTEVEANSVPGHLRPSRDSHPRSLRIWLSSCVIQSTPLGGCSSEFRPSSGQHPTAGEHLGRRACDLLPDPTKEGLKLNQLKFAGQRHVERRREPSPSLCRELPRPGSFLPKDNQCIHITALKL